MYGFRFGVQDLGFKVDRLVFRVGLGFMVFGLTRV